MNTFFIENYIHVLYVENSIIIKKVKIQKNVVQMNAKNITKNIKVNF